MAALVEHVGQVLGRAHALFGSGGAGDVVALDAGPGLSGATGAVRNGQRTMAGLTGVLPATYSRFAAAGVQALDVASGTDGRLGVGVRDASGANRSGWAHSGAVVRGAAADTTGLAPLSGTPAGQRALIATLRGRVAQQQQVVNSYRAQDARLAAMLRALAYARASGGGPGGALMGALPSGLAGFGGRGGGGSPFSGLSALSGLVRAGGGGSRNPHVALADWSSGAGNPNPGQGAAAAALSKRGCPYVWGAKGPGRFDCSGLTQWAWRQAGVQLGSDTYTQIRQGTPVPPGQVRAGDLIFPLDSFGGNGPGHVQLAISDHQVVHAPQAGDVVRVAPMPGRFLARRPVRPGVI
ncbi:C40 family peptidase [Mycobacterium intracellulare]|uniref:C40 family peptidase n=1 Tax=Mycobacterium intracellulare TaxID=1767 RepID=UPI000A848E6C|nr:NlpC/P60 family protein [Mycobacterium intracellulare]